MNNKFEYRGFNFNINVELNHKVEKCIDGKRLHLITINDMGQSNYYKKIETTSDDLKANIVANSILAKEWVDKQLDKDKSPDEILLASLGFK